MLAAKILAAASLLAVLLASRKTLTRHCEMPALPKIASISCESFKSALTPTATKEPSKYPFRH